MLKQHINQLRSTSVQEKKELAPRTLGKENKTVESGPNSGPNIKNLV